MWAGLLDWEQGELLLVRGTGAWPRAAVGPGAHEEAVVMGLPPERGCELDSRINKEPKSVVSR